MRIRLSFVPSALLVLGGVASAQHDWESPSRGPWYFAFGGGINFIEDSAGFSPDEGYAVNGAVGYRLGHAADGNLALNLEAEVFYSENDLDDFPISFGLVPDDLNTTVVFGNLIADWYWTDATAFYFGGGGGWATDISLFDAEEDGFTWQGKAGLRFELGGGFSWNVGFRYLETPDVADAGDFENTQYVAETGVRWVL